MKSMKVTLVIAEGTPLETVNSAQMNPTQGDRKVMWNLACDPTAFKVYLEAS